MKFLSVQGNGRVEDISANISAALSTSESKHDLSDESFQPRGRIILFKP